MRLTWLEAKRRANREKHGVDFAGLAELFAGPMLVQLDTRQDYGEDRWLGIGMAHQVTLVVIFCEFEDAPGEPVIRLISARKATRHESQAFAQSLADRPEPPAPDA